MCIDTTICMACGRHNATKEVDYIEPLSKKEKDRGDKPEINRVYMCAECSAKPHVLRNVAEVYGFKY